VLPEGEEIVSGLELAQRLRELSIGFYYYWDWPNGEPDHEWLDKRAAYRRQVRLVVKLNRKGLDTPGLVKKAILRGLESNDPTHQGARLVRNRPDLVHAWLEWSEQQQTKEQPPTRARWLSDYVLVDMCERVNASGQQTIIWYPHRTVCERLTAAQGIAVAYPGKPVPDAPIVALSMRSHSKGLNLQRYTNNIVLTPPSSGAMWEQMLGRTHRFGQEADTVCCTAYSHTPSLAGAIDRARERARYMEKTMQQPQKLLLASWIDC
jgi:hypothetical protein